MVISHAVKQIQRNIELNGLRNTGTVPLDLTLLNESDVLKSGDTVSGRVEGANGRSVALFLVNGAGRATNLKPWVSRTSDGSMDFSFTGMPSSAFGAGLVRVISISLWRAWAQQ